MTGRLAATGLAMWGLVVFLAAAPAASPTGQAPPSATDDAGAELFGRMCSECHDSKRIVAKRRTSADWEDTLKKMIEEGAEGTEKDFEGVFGYLVRHFGRVYINTAKNTEIRDALGITIQQADAIVAYRTTNGPFADAEAVKKVPGLDATKIEDFEGRLAF